MSPVSSDAPIILVGSPDPDVMVLQGMVLGLHHFNTRDLSLRHFKLMVATELSRRAFKVHPTKDQIALLSRMRKEDMEPEFGDLLERRYLHQIVPPFGEITYKLGSMGGTLIRHMLKQKDKDGSSKKRSPQKAGLRARRAARTEGDASGSGGSST